MAMTRRTLLRGSMAIAATSGLGRLTAYAESPDTRPDATRQNDLLFCRQAFSFLHTYEATGRYWRGIEKAGLVRKGTGVRLVQSPWGDDLRRFNAVARIGGELHGIISRQRGPFVIDRVTGGAPFHQYDFDQNLIAQYAELLGPRLLGGQVHEVVCNVHNDWNRLVKANPKFASEPVRPDEVRSYFDWNSADHWLEYGTLDDYAGRVHPATPAGWWKEVDRGARTMGARFGGHFCYAEGSVHGERTWHVLYRLGAAYGLAEVGPWASQQSQLMIASLRGAARAAGRPWGVFFAPWGPGGCTCFIPEKDWSWQCPSKQLTDSGWPVGPEAGPSSALQRRIFFHAYLAGAHTLHEEWGAECNLTNWDSATLSSYGKVTRDLLDFQAKHPDVGEPYTPLALAIDASIPPPDPARWTAMRAALFKYTPQDERMAAKPGSSKQEADCYGPCAIPEIFDIVPSDAPAALWEQYKQVIAIDPGAGPARATSLPADQPAPSLLEAARALSPFDRKTHAPMQINRRRADGTWIVGLYNPWGAKRGDVNGIGSVLVGACVLHETLRAKAPIRSAHAIHAWPAGTGVEVRGDELDVTVGPGGVIIIEIEPTAGS